MINQLNPVYPQLGVLVPAHFPFHLLLVQNLLPLGGKQLLIGSSGQGCTSPLSLPLGLGVGMALLAQVNWDLTAYTSTE